MNAELHYQELMWSGTPLDSTVMTGAQNSPLLPTQTACYVDASNANTVDLPLHSESTALLLVDVQPEYWSFCPDVRRDFEDTFPSSVAKLLRIARERNTKIIWVRADYRYSHSPWLQQFHRIHQGRISAEVTCNIDDDEVEWESFASPLPHELVLTKTSWSSTQNTSLINCLQTSGMDTVLVCGLITSVCVQHSAFGIFEAGFRTLLVTDCCADRGRARHSAALALYGDYMYELVTVENLKTTLQERSKEKENNSRMGKDAWHNNMTGEEATRMTLSTVSTKEPEQSRPGVVHSISVDSFTPLALNHDDDVAFAYCETTAHENG